VASIFFGRYKPGWFRLVSSVVRILPALFHCCPPGAGKIGLHKPVAFAVLLAFYTVVLWRRDNSAFTSQLLM